MNQTINCLKQVKRQCEVWKEISSNKRIEWAFRNSRLLQQTKKHVKHVTNLFVERNWTSHEKLNAHLKKKQRKFQSLKTNVEHVKLLYSSTNQVFTMEWFFLRKDDKHWLFFLFNVRTKLPLFFSFLFLTHFSLIFYTTDFQFSFLICLCISLQSLYKTYQRLDCLFLRSWINVKSIFGN